MRLSESNRIYGSVRFDDRSSKESRLALPSRKEDCIFLHDFASERASTITSSDVFHEADQFYFLFVLMANKARLLTNHIALSQADLTLFPFQTFVLYGHWAGCYVL